MNISFIKSGDFCGFLSNHKIENKQNSWQIVLQLIDF
jgi:hypothetical protein